MPLLLANIQWKMSDRIHARVPCIDPPSGRPVTEIPICGDPDVLPLRMLDPVAFALVGMHNDRARMGYCDRCAEWIYDLSNCAILRSHTFAR